MSRDIIPLSYFLVYLTLIVFQFPTGQSGFSLLRNEVERSTVNDQRSFLKTSAFLKKTTSHERITTLGSTFASFSKNRVPLCSALGVWYATAAVVLIVFAGFASGSTVGLMSLDPVQLKVLEVVGTDAQKKAYDQQNKRVLHFCWCLKCSSSVNADKTTSFIISHITSSEFSGYGNITYFFRSTCTFMGSRFAICYSNSNFW